MSYIDGNEDRLSSLPEKVLSQILSLIPTELAVRTSILSKRWRYTWTFVTNLDFNNYHPTYALKCFPEFVDGVLERCKTTQLNMFRLDNFCDSVQRESVSKWINEAVQLNVCELDIQVRTTKLPLSLFTCKTLTKLRLVLSSNDLDVFNVPSPVTLPSLKTLDLRVSKICSVSIFKFIHGCPVLESLFLEIKWPDDEQYFNIPTLKRLKLISTSSRLLNSKVVLNVPNLKYLFVGGQSCPHFVMEDLSSLVQATVFDGFGDYHDKAFKLMKGLSGVKSFSLFTLNLKARYSYSPLPIFPNLKNLELRAPSGSQWLLLINILESSPELGNLSFEEIAEEASWIKPKPVPTCVLPKLKTMKYTKCKGGTCDIEFLKFILRKAEVLKTLTIICGRLPVKEELEMHGRLLKFPKASKFCEIHFVGS